MRWRRALPFYPLLPLGALIAIVWANTEGDSYFRLAQALTHFESALAYPLQAVAFLFGLVNAGVLWRGFETGTWAVLTASLAGRPLGVLITAPALTVIGVESERYVRWRDLVVIACIVTVGSVFALFVSTAVFPVGPLLMQARLGAIATLAGVSIAAAAARALRVGRFAGSTGV